MWPWPHEDGILLQFHEKYPRDALGVPGVLS